MKLLLIQQKMIGDVLVTSMLCEQIKTQFPNATVHYLIHKGTKDVVLNHPFIDELILFDPKEDSSYANFRKFGKQLRKERYDVVVDVYAKLSTAILSYMSKAKTRISYHKSYSNFLYTQTIKKSTEAKTNMGLTIEERISLLSPIDIKPNYSIYPKIFISDKEKNEMDLQLDAHQLDRSKKTFMMSIIGSAPNKTYPLAYMSKVVDWVAETTDCNLLFNYIPNQLEEAKKIFEGCKKSTQEKVYFNLLGKSLREFIVLMSLCDGIIGNDGGAINIAKALNKPSYIIFSPWINKASWNTFEDAKYHRTVHIQDFNNKASYSRKEAKENVEEYYQKFQPELFKEDLKSFVGFISEVNLDTYKLEQSIKVY